jgi:DNA-binding GntR family transcriptional regulator
MSGINMVSSKFIEARSKISSLSTLKCKRSKPLREEVYDVLREAIISGELKPNQRLIEEDLASETGASRTPIREAMRKLEGENLVAKVPKGGFVVRPFTVQDIDEIFGIRSVLESYAAYLTTLHLSDKILRRLEEVINNFDDALRKGDTKQLIKHNTVFHDILYKACGSRILYDLIMRLWGYFYRYRRVLIDVPEAAYLSSQEHRAMLEAMRQRDAGKVEAFVREHILRGKDILLNEIKAGRTEI